MGFAGNFCDTGAVCCTGLALLTILVSFVTSESSLLALLLPFRPWRAVKKAEKRLFNICFVLYQVSQKGCNIYNEKKIVKVEIKDSILAKNPIKLALEHHDTNQILVVFQYLWNIQRCDFWMVYTCSILFV